MQFSNHKATIPAAFFLILQILNNQKRRKHLHPWASGETCRGSERKWRKKVQKTNKWPSRTDICDYYYNHNKRKYSGNTEFVGKDMMPLNTVTRFKDLFFSSCFGMIFNSAVCLNLYFILFYRFEIQKNTSQIFKLLPDILDMLGEVKT